MPRTLYALEFSLFCSIVTGVCAEKALNTQFSPFKSLHWSESFTSQQVMFESAPADVTSGPTVSRNFQALPDNNTAIPPDTHGAAGPTHIMTMLNTQVRDQDKSGNVILTKTLYEFWAPAPGRKDLIADPRIVYDHSSGRWIATSLTNPIGYNPEYSAILFAISATSDPSGAWYFYRFDADPSNTYWADFPDIGVNSVWIVLTCNLFEIGATLDWPDASMWVIRKSSVLQGGAVAVTWFPLGFDYSGVVNNQEVHGSSLRPCVTFGSDIGEIHKLYMVDNPGFETSSGIPSSGFLR